jgi:predicted transcriptional regulator of viral defense system
MQLPVAIKAFQELDRNGLYIFSRADIQKMFPEEKEKAMEKSLERLIKVGILERVCKGFYAYALAKSKKNRVIEDIAMVLRRGSYSYVSLESLLSEYGDISQIPVSTLTVMTTGPKGTYKTKYGTIEFTHTKRAISEIFKKTIYDPKRRLRIATREGARQDLLRVGRNLSMITND